MTVDGGCTTHTQVVTLQDCIIAKDAGSRRVCVAILLTELINAADNGLTVNTPVAAIRYGKSAQKFHVVEIVFCEAVLTALRS
jgi:hypothetical protein